MNKLCDYNVFCFDLSCLRAIWLMEPNPDAEHLFSMVAEVFIFWAKSHVRMTHNSFFFFFYAFFSCHYPSGNCTIKYAIYIHLCLLQQNFKWEEQNYVVQNEINNLAFLVNNDKMFKVSRISSDIITLM